MGFCNNVFPIYLPYLEDELLTGTQGSALISIRCLFGILGMLFVDRFFQRFSLRIGLVITCFITSLAFAVYAVSDVPWSFYLGAAVSGIGYGLGSMIPVAILIRNWFNCLQNTAIGICAAGSGISTILFPPLLTWVVEKAGIGVGFSLQSVFSLLVGLSVFAVVRDTPEQKQLLPYGCGQGPEKTLKTHPKILCKPSEPACFSRSALVRWLELSLLRRRAIFPRTFRPRAIPGCLSPRASPYLAAH